MAFDWSKYPLLPEPPVLPDWLETPEQEAWNVEYKKASEFHLHKWHWIIWAVVVIGCLGYFGASDTSDVIIILLFASFGLLLLLAAWIFVYQIFKYIQISRKYHIWSASHRPDPYDSLRAIYVARPDAASPEYEKFWPTAEHVKIARALIQVSGTCSVPEKMIFPNDPLGMVLFPEFGDRFDMDIDAAWKVFMRQCLISEAHLEQIAAFLLAADSQGKCFAELVELCMVDPNPGNSEAPSAGV